ncbi:MAG: peptidyl-prolyl cis-trans isomerase [Verrucomicrobiales bacterium]|nr:peptidyl-prolyl cis-trans isomerase [Verrucomicrobiales bacterium]
MRTICFLLLGIHVSGVAAMAQGRTNLANGVMAWVNQSIITYQQVQEQMMPSLPPLMRQYRNQPQELEKKLGQLRSEVLEGLIDHRLIIDEFKASGGLIPDRYIEDEIKNRIRDRFGDRVSLTRELQAKGQTSEDFREDVKETIIADFMRRRNLSNEKILISPRKIENFYQTNQNEFMVGEGVRLRIITLNKPGGDDNASKKKLGEELLAKLRSGTPFAELAITYSEDSFAREGGDRKEMLETSTLREEFREPASKLPLKTASSLIETPDGFYILQVEDRKVAHVRPLDEVRDEIEKTLVLQERSRLQERWLKRLRKKSFIVYL